MTDPQAIDAFRELVARGLIAAQPAPIPLARGNVDRNDPARGSWRATLASGAPAKLTLGRDLSSLATRHAALTGACPTIGTGQLHYVRLAACDVLMESFFEGFPLELAAIDGSLPGTVVRQAVTDIRAALAATEQPSTESARADEWKAWSECLLALPVWQPTEADSLKNTVLLVLYARLASEPPVTRWTNGDFLPANILANSSGESRLIDAEFASRTHFFAEDAVRFQVLSPAVQDQPEVFAGLLPEPGLPWHLYFWLRQFQLEAGQNSAAYLARVRPIRLGLIRRLAEQILGITLPEWSLPPLAVEHGLEDSRWLLDTEHLVQFSGWCHVPAASRMRAIVARGPGRRLAMVPSGERPDVQQHFLGEPRALSSGFVLSFDPKPADFPITLCAVIDHGTLVPFQILEPDDLPRGALFWTDYPGWAATHDPDPAPNTASAGEPGPLFSILLPVYRTPEAFLHACVQSVRNQHYPRWELCVVDDGSGVPGLTDALQKMAASDSRIRLQTRAANGGISAATNDALAMARGDFVVFLDHDDLLRPHALAEFSRRLGREPALDALYSDEDKITADGRRLLPFLKPDYSPEFLLGVMYIGHALAVRTSVARAAGGFDPAFDGVQDYEFFLRVTEQTRRIGHVPRILYHWRQSPDSSALHGNIKGDMDQRQVQAVQAHLRRRGDRRTARPTGGHRVRLENPAHPTFEKIHAPDPGSALAALRQAASSSTVEVLVLLTVEPRSAPDAVLAELAALAALPDSGCVAPLLVSAEGRVYESGLAGSVPIMRGFNLGSDGYHGTLRCNREVDAVSPACIAVRRKLVSDATAAAAGWPAFCAGLRGQGLFHRVCASARVQLKASCRGPDTPGSNGSRGEFYPPAFDAGTGDYTLGGSARGELSPNVRVEFYLDQPVGWDDLPRCLISRGWCFSAPGNPVTGIRLRMVDHTLAGVVGLSRPDVLAARPDAPDEFTGFEIRGTLPSGRHELALEACLADGSWKLLMTRTVTVPRRVLPLWLGGGDWTELMFFQMPAHMAHPPRPVRPENFPVGKPAANRPRFSIVTPSFQQARYLAETMRSVLEQQPGVAIDYVVQDGGSTDGSVEIIAGFAPSNREAGDRRPEMGTKTGSSSSDANADPASRLPPPVSPRLRAWASERDAGQADAIARGFVRTSGGPGDLMAWINSDDFYLPGALGYVADYFAAHPDVDVIYGHRIVVDHESREIARWFLPRHDPAVLGLNDFVPQETLFWRRRVWDKVGGIDPAYKFAMDWDLLLRFQAAGARIVRVPRFLACFRVHPAQKTSARMHDLGQKEITLLRERTQGRPYPPGELERNPLLLAYLRRSAFIQWLWSLGLRAP